jgi:hypothetical protein
LTTLGNAANVEVDSESAINDTGVDVEPEAGKGIVITCESGSQPLKTRFDPVIKAVPSTLYALGEDG